MMRLLIHRRLGKCSGLVVLLWIFVGITPQLHAQGMPLDSILPRLSHDLHDDSLAHIVPSLFPNPGNLRVWGLAVGDFTNDSLPDLAISLYDISSASHNVTVYLFGNTGHHTFTKFLEESVPYFESPIEVGLTIDGTVATIVQKISETNWKQTGYSVEYGDVVLVDRYDTESKTIPKSRERKAFLVGHDIYRNYETLWTKESYHSSDSTIQPFSASYMTLPAYDRMRNLYPGYGSVLRDTSAQFVLRGASFRKDASDMSIKSILAAYTNDNLYLTLRIADDYIVGSTAALDSGDHISLWFDTKYTGDRQNRDRRVASDRDGIPTFRNSIDSLVTNLTFGIPALPGRITALEHRAGSLTALQQQGWQSIRGKMEYDTSGGLVRGYVVKLKIPFAYLNLEANPVQFYEKVQTKEKEITAPLPTLLQGIGDVPSMGFTAVVYDVDDAMHPEEMTMQATSAFQPGNPATFGTLILEPSSLYYGQVRPTYIPAIQTELEAAGF